MKIPTHEQLITGLLPAVLEAARLELRYFRDNVAVERKADASPVTIADQEAEVLIVEALKQIAADVPIVAEEQFSAGIIPEVDGTLFLVDALDGTRAFVKGTEDFTINVAMVVDRVPVFGLILLPANGEFYVTTADDRVGYAQIDVQKNATLDDISFIPVHTRRPDPEALVVSLSNSHPSAKLERELEGKPISGRVEAGSSLKFCRVAEGRADFYPRLGSICEWDIAAGHAIVRSAGGDVTRLDGSPLLYGNRAKNFRTPPFVAWGREDLVGKLQFTAE